MYIYVSYTTTIVSMVYAVTNYVQFYFLFPNENWSDPIVASAAYIDDVKTTKSLKNIFCPNFPKVAG